MLTLPIYALRRFLAPDRHRLRGLELTEADSTLSLFASFPARHFGRASPADGLWWTDSTMRPFLTRFSHKAGFYWWGDRFCQALNIERNVSDDPPPQVTSDMEASRRDATSNSATRVTVTPCSLQLLQTSRFCEHSAAAAPQAVPGTSSVLAMVGT